MNHNVIIKPIVTEKSMQGNLGKYTFLVAGSATKAEIRNAFKTSFSVNIVSISTSKIKGKRKRIGARRVEVNETATKKATILLKKGEKLSIFESGEDKKENKKKSR
ncbi:MAG TPA: 50S ribosomal protein L23 [Xanthomonadales bacterium]|nr:50S ribosomal protein L23 [Xanthomonadales bacterium]